MIEKTGSPITELNNLPKLTEKDVIEYVKERFEDLKIEPTMNDLVSFHSNNKYLLMSHSPSELKILNIAAVGADFIAYLAKSPNSLGKERTILAFSRRIDSS